MALHLRPRRPYVCTSSAAVAEQQPLAAVFSSGRGPRGGRPRGGFTASGGVQEQEFVMEEGGGVDGGGGWTSRQRRMGEAVLIWGAAAGSANIVAHPPGRPWGQESDAT
jgi:hypothetical protein